MLENLLSIRELTKEQLISLIRDSSTFLELSTRSIKKAPALRGKTVVNLFFEPSTRTRASFEIAAKRLSADAINISSTASSVTKGESLYDTARTLEAMVPDVIVIRHPHAGAAHFLANILDGTSVVNAGDGAHEHPTQALLDCVALNNYFKEEGGLFEKERKIAIVGDIMFSRVARSNIFAHQLLGNKVTLVGPPSLVPPILKSAFIDEVDICHNLEEGIAGKDIIIVLRVQFERHKESYISSIDEYSRYYCLNSRIVSKYAPEAVVLHPGPVNRGVEISSELADSSRALIGYQVECGVASRMAILFRLIIGKRKEEGYDIDREWRSTLS